MVVGNNYRINNSFGKSVDMQISVAARSQAAVGWWKMEERIAYLRLPGRYGTITKSRYVILGSSQKYGFINFSRGVA
jgi:hypothetical protein